MAEVKLSPDELEEAESNYRARRRTLVRDWVVARFNVFGAAEGVRREAEQHRDRLKAEIADLDADWKALESAAKGS